MIRTIQHPFSTKYLDIVKGFWSLFFFLGPICISIGLFKRQVRNPLPEQGEGANE